jgi:uncharacterized protein (UPF0332 family)
MENRILALSKYRMEKAIDDLETSEIMFQNNKFSQSVNRSYYAMFHAVRALLALRRFDSKKHSGIISYFNQHYVKTGEIEKEYSKFLTAAFKLRTDSDYNDFYIVSKEDAMTQLENAKKFTQRIKQYIEEK